MDPLTALGFASNVIQLISFTSDLISKSREIYKSANGTLIENLELEAIVSNLQDLSNRLSFQPGGKGKSKLSNTDMQLQKLCEDCNAVSEQLIEAINGLKINESHGKWSSFRQALKKKYRSEIDTTLLVSIREQIQRDESTSAKDSRRKGRHIDKTQEEAKEWEEKIMKELHLNRLELYNQQNMVSFSSKLSAYSKDTRDQLVQKRILSKLRFDDIADRYEGIEEAHRKTLEWIFSKDRDLNKNSTSVQSSSFVDWLKNEKEDLYWITGKPGSGKSTLMKFLFNDPRTLENLQAWADQKILVTAGFFFWNSGTTMQMSRMGLLQSLLYRSIGECLEKIPVLFPERWKSYELFGGDLRPWTWPELTYAFKSLISDGSRNYFFLIDGLDEFDGNCDELADFVLKHSKNKNIKICVASRPWLVFEDAFQRQPSLRMEDLTAKDIHIFVSEKLRQNNMFLRLESIQGEEAQKLIVGVTDKAFGVFLWVRLVVTSLLEGLRDGDNIMSLLNRLLALPSDLEDLFLKILDNLKLSYFEEASKLFQMVHAADEMPSIGREQVSLLDLSFAEEGLEEAISAKTEAISFDQLEFRAETMRRRLSSRCKGLLEASAAGRRHDSSVYYLHRTVKDFMEKPQRWNYIVSGTSQLFNPNKSLCGSYLHQLKVVILTIPKEFKTIVESCAHYSTKFDEKDAVLNVKALSEMDRAANEQAKKNCWLGSITPSGERISHWSEIVEYENPPKSFLEYAFRKKFHLYITHSLDAGCDPNLRISEKPLLALAVASQDIKMVRTLFDRGADPNLFYGGGYSTPWNDLLYKMIISPQIGPIDKEFVYEALPAFLGHNADLNLTVSNLTLREFIQNRSHWLGAERTAELLVKLPAPKTKPGTQRHPTKALHGFKNLFRSLR